MLGSCLMMGLEGPSLLKEEKDFIASNHIAGFVLFKRNIQSFRQVYELCSELKSLSEPSPLIAIDMEGGRVNRFSHLKESFPWPSPKVLRTLRPKQVFLIARSMAKQLRVLGIDINFAPVVDLLSVRNPLLEDRVFGESKGEVLQGASSFIEGLLEEKQIPCLKHFPGHGGVGGDSHKTLPKDPRSLKELEAQLDIFQILFDRYPCWVMTAHIEFSLIDQKPATFSKIFLKEELRERRAFKGLVVSDDIDMKALEAFSSGEKFFYALKGGCNLVLTGQGKETVGEIIEWFQQNPGKKKELGGELRDSSQKIGNIRKKTKKLFPDFKRVERELSKTQREKLLI